MRPRALVVGGSRRVGAAVALELARSGFDLCVTWRDDQAGAKEVARVAGVRGAACRTVRLDLGSVDGGSLPPELTDGAYDAVVLSAAAWEPTPWGEMRRASALQMLQVNAVGPVLLIQALASGLAQSRLPGGGSVVAIGDIHAHGTPVRGYGAYLMSKAALHQAVQQMAAELAPKVRVNGILPGVVAWPEGMAAETRDAILRRVPAGRSGTPDDVAALARFLCLEAPFMTGALLPLDGGRSIR